MNSSQIWGKMNKGVFIIAEIGKNFIQTEEEKSVEEYLANAKQLVDKAAEAGADAVKFQTHYLEDEISPNANYVSPHFKNWSKEKGGRYAWVKRNFLATPIAEFWRPLKDYTESKGLVFFSTPMSRGAAQLLYERVGVDLWKIGSGDILDFVMLDYIRHTDKPVILSSGMSTLEEVEKSFNFLKRRNERVALLHCVFKYPCPPEDLRLGTMNLLREKFSAPIGSSDHSIDPDPPIAAVAMGAKILEKHFTKSRKCWGPDHKASLEPKEFKEMVEAVRVIENDFGKRAVICGSDFVKRADKDYEKTIQEQEGEFRPLFRKSLVAGTDIPVGASILPGMIHATRPQSQGGLPSENYELVLGRVVKTELKKHAPITWDVLI